MLIRKDRNIGIQPNRGNGVSAGHAAETGVPPSRAPLRDCERTGKKEGEEQRYSEDDQTERLNSTLRN
jgi:hypothetical protein